MKEMVLVEGEVTYKIKIATLVNKETANNEDKMKELFEKLSYKDIDCFEECEVKYNNKVPVSINEELSKKYAEDNLGSSAWQEILEKNNDFYQKSEKLWKMQQLEDFKEELNSSEY